MKVLTVIQARTSSTRLPGKVLLPLGDCSVLEQMWKRVRASRLKGDLVIATTVEPQDLPIVELCEDRGIPCFRGHPTDLLDRHYQLQKDHQAEAVVKIPSDCPLIDPAAIDRVIGFFLDAGGAYDYVSNLHPQSYPDGNDVEVMSAEALKKAWCHATRSIDREHTTTYLWDHPELFRIGNVVWEKGIDLSRSHRWTLDYPADYELIRAVNEELGSDNALFGVDAIVELLAKRPAIHAINARYLGDSWYQRHAHELNSPPAPGVVML